MKQVEIFTFDGVLRMKQTTDLIVKKLNEAGFSCTRQSDGRLGGKNHGIFNASTAEARLTKSELVIEKKKREQLTAQEKFETPVEGGKSKRDIATKTSQLFKEIYQNPNRPTYIVVVTSNNTLEAMTALLNQEKPCQKMEVKYPDILHLQQSADQLKFVQIHNGSLA